MPWFTSRRGLTTGNGNNFASASKRTAGHAMRRVGFAWNAGQILRFLRSTTTQRSITRCPSTPITSDPGMTIRSCDTRSKICGPRTDDATCSAASGHTPAMANTMGGLSRTIGEQAPAIEPGWPRTAEIGPSGVRVPQRHGQSLTAPLGQRLVGLDASHGRGDVGRRRRCSDWSSCDQRMVGLGVVAPPLARGEALHHGGIIVRGDAIHSLADDVRTVGAQGHSACMVMHRGTDYASSGVDATLLDVTLGD
jgi:hypothetical protein